MRENSGPGRSGTHEGWQVKRTGTGRRILFCLIPCLAVFLLRLTATHASGGGDAGDQDGLNWWNFFWISVNIIVLDVVLY